MGAQDEDHTQELASILGVSELTFAGAFGAAWFRSPARVPHDFDSDPSGGLDHEPTPWFLGGDPPHLMARVFDHGLFLAVPKGYWAEGTHGLEYWPDQQQYLSADDLDTAKGEALVRDLLRRRRSGFRYCRYCRRPTPPELRVGDSCMGCVGAWEGVVY